MNYMDTESLGSWIIARRCGVKKDPASFVIVYHEGLRTRKHTVDLRSLVAYPINEQYGRILEHERHGKVVSIIPKWQVLRMLAILKDLREGMDLKECIQRADNMEKLSSTEDLNKVTDEELER